MSSRSTNGGRTSPAPTGSGAPSPSSSSPSISLSSSSASSIDRRRPRSNLPRPTSHPPHSSSRVPHSNHGPFNTPTPSDDPFASYLTYSRSQNPPELPVSSRVSFTTSLAMRRKAQVAKILSNLKKSPLLNPFHVSPISSSPHPPSLLTPPTLTFLPQLTVLSHHPSLALLTYPPSTYLAHQGTFTSLVNVIVSGRVRLMRDGVVCAEAEKGGMIGVEGALMGSERYRRHRRSQRRRRLLEKQALEPEDLIVPSGAPRVVNEVERQSVDDEKEMKLDVEDVEGKKRRLRFPQFCTVQCLDTVECIVFPASLLLSYIESDKAMTSHAFKWVTALHWMRRSQWREGELRLRRLWGGQCSVEQSGVGEEAEAAPLNNGPVLERKVLGTAGFAYYSLVSASKADEERMRRLTHEQNVSIEHPMFSHPHGEGGGPIERHRLKVIKAGARGGDRQQKEEIKKVKEKEDKARKVRRIVDAMERKRREVGKGQATREKSSTATATFLDSDESDSDYDEEEEEEEEVDPVQLDERYTAAIVGQRHLIAPHLLGKKANRGATPRGRGHRRLQTKQLEHSPEVWRHLAIMGNVEAEDVASSRLQVHVSPPVTAEKEGDWGEGRTPADRWRERCERRRGGEWRFTGSSAIRRPFLPPSLHSIHYPSAARQYSAAVIPMAVSGSEAPTSRHLPPPTYGEGGATP